MCIIDESNSDEMDVSCCLDTYGARVGYVIVAVALRLGALGRRRIFDRGQANHERRGALAGRTGARPRGRLRLRPGQRRHAAQDLFDRLCQLSLPRPRRAAPALGRCGGPGRPVPVRIQGQRARRVGRHRAERAAGRHAGAAGRAARRARWLVRAAAQQRARHRVARGRAALSSVSSLYCFYSLSYRVLSAYLCISAF